MNEDKRGYSGWSNYETWCVNLWLRNDYESQAYWDNAAKYAMSSVNKSTILSDSENARHSLAEHLKNSIDDSRQDKSSGLFVDLLNSALSLVNWAEIADGYLEECEGYEPMVVRLEVL